MPQPATSQRWIDLLTEEDVAFIKRLILTSGSLKDLAVAYSVSYPTVRLRLDRLIDKITALETRDGTDDYERLLRGLFAEGKLDESSFKLLRKTYLEQKPSP